MAINFPIIIDGVEYATKEDLDNAINGIGDVSGGFHIASIICTRWGEVVNSDPNVVVRLSGNTKDKYLGYIISMPVGYPTLTMDDYIPATVTYGYDGVEQLLAIGMTIDALLEIYQMDTVEELQAALDYTEYKFELNQTFMQAGFQLYFINYSDSVNLPSFSNPVYRQQILPGDEIDYMGIDRDGAPYNDYSRFARLNDIVYNYMAKLAKSLRIGDQVGSMYMHMYPTDLTNMPTYGNPNIHFMEFSDGSWLGEDNGNLVYWTSSASETVIYEGNTLVTPTFQLNPDITVSNVILTLSLPGPWYTATISAKPDDINEVVTIESLYNELKTLEDTSIDTLSNTVTQLQSTIATLQQQLDDTTNNLTLHVAHDADLYQAILVAAREEAQEVYNGSQPPLSTTGTTLVGPGGLLTLGGNETYTAPENGGITITFSAVLALGTVQVLVNGVSVFDSSAISLLSVPPPKTVRVNGGDIITTTGALGLLSSLSVVFYPNANIT